METALSEHLSISDRQSIMALSLFSTAERSAHCAINDFSLIYTLQQSIPILLYQDHVPPGQRNTQAIQQYVLSHQHLSLQHTVRNVHRRIRH